MFQLFVLFFGGFLCCSRHPVFKSHFFDFAGPASLDRFWVVL